VYLRLVEDQAWDSVATDLLEDCAQLTKANSIEGTVVSLLMHGMIRRRVARLSKGKGNIG
jgi:hypothetical protein